MALLLRSVSGKAAPPGLSSRAAPMRASLPALAGLTPSSAGQSCLPGEQRRWRATKRGQHGPTLPRHFPTEVKMEFPPKDRSSAMLLPESKTVCFVTNAWYYKDGVRSPDAKVVCPVLSFVARHTRNYMDSLTLDEVKALEGMLPDIKKQFEEAKKMVSQAEEQNDVFTHVCK
eukprot:TRINITY_DN41073_c0_g2_i1.p2 TRINITY_DN41073_c0_g2~~TRINITY_DN41073_c0_g2_i1.p2  ORF type:complete len:194 (+),score=34.76 TRINITY_DN41073_c0_g2_i1:65-583(+)